jgi:hypothetical protein
MVLKTAKVLIATIGLCLGSAAFAENFVDIFTSQSGTIYKLDTESIRTYSNNSVEGWLKFDASKDKRVPWRTRKNKFRINCTTETFGSLYEVDYRADGTVMRSDSNEYPKMVPVIPGTIGKLVFDLLCSK